MSNALHARLGPQRYRAVESEPHHFTTLSPSSPLLKKRKEDARQHTHTCCSPSHRNASGSIIIIDLSLNTVPSVHSERCQAGRTLLGAVRCSVNGAQRTHAAALALIWRGSSFVLLKQVVKRQPESGERATESRREMAIRYHQIVLNG